ILRGWQEAVHERKSPSGRTSCNCSVKKLAHGPARFNQNSAPLRKIKFKYQGIFGGGLVIGFASSGLNKCPFLIERPRGTVRFPNLQKHFPSATALHMVQKLSQQTGAQSSATRRSGYGH